MTRRVRAALALVLAVASAAVGLLLPAGGGYTLAAFVLAVVALDVVAPLLDPDPAVVVRTVTVDEACAAMPRKD